MNEAEKEERKSAIVLGSDEVVVFEWDETNPQGKVFFNFLNVCGYIYHIKDKRIYVQFKSHRAAYPPGTVNGDE